MLWVYGHYKYFLFFQRGDRLRRQNLTSKVGPRVETVKVTITAYIHFQSYSNLNFADISNSVTHLKL